MPRANRTIIRDVFSLAIIVFACSGLASCGPDSKEAIWILGSHLFLIYAVSVAALLLLQKLHKMDIFLKLVEQIKSPASVVGGVATVAGGWVVLSNTPQLFAEPGPEKLKPFLGVMVLITGIHLFLWARVSDAKEKAAVLKIAFMSFVYGAAMLFILNGTGILALP